ncbi:MupA/Atu3671 family FMN-dependent luciferase-like monooxygenase [Mesorhizobium sp. M0618]|uniref:MupA/Atu3671 family FMN-dependent luciferase-like monooxygenase n=1 Tax=unclassified Mesorhizobium TaxID=325217 RepID=UPI003335ED46
MFFSTSSGTDAAAVYGHIGDVARMADAEKMTRIWLPERHFVDFGAVHPNPAVLAAALSSCTKTIRLAAGSVVAPLHDPLRIVEEWSVVDNLSGGRVDIALAPGWRAEDFALAPDLYADRHRVLVERAADVRHLWRGEAIDRLAGNGRRVEIRTRPRPLQSELPLWITAARNPETFKLAGALGANLLTYLVDLGFDPLRARIADYRKARAAAGLDPSGGIVTVMLHTHLAGSSGEARARARDPYVESVLHNRHLIDIRGAEQLTEAQAQQIAATQFERLFERLSLVGSIDAGVSLVARLESIGVDEIACLLDFVEDFETVASGLPALAEFVARLRLRALRSTAAICPQHGTEAVQRYSGADFYHYIESIGGHYGPAFQRIEEITLLDHRAEVTLAMPDAMATSDPILIDAIVSAAHAFALRPALRGSMRPLALPIGIGRLHLTGARADRYHVTARERSRDADKAEFDMTVVTEAGAPVAVLERVTFKRLPLTNGDPRTTQARTTLRRLEWSPLGLPADPPPVSWTVWCADEAMEASLANALEACSGHGLSRELVVPQRGSWQYGDLEAPREATLRTLVQIQRLRDQGGMIPIVVLVRGAHAFAGDDFLPDPAAAAAWAAAGSVISAPGRVPVRVLDVSPMASPLEQAQMLRLFAAQDAVTMAAARHGALIAPNLVPVLAASAHRDVRPVGRTLVSGGHGDLGGLLIDWLVEDGCSKVVALSRSGRRHHGDAQVRKAHLVDIRADVSMLGEVSHEALRLPFDTIFHLAGVDVEDLADVEAIAAAFCPKLDGLLALGDIALRLGAKGLLVLFVSSAGLLGATGQAAYAAANAAAMAAANHLRQRTGLAIRTLALDPVRDLGMARKPGVAASLAARGIATLDPTVALRAVGLALACEFDDIVISAPGNHVRATTPRVGAETDSVAPHPPTQAGLERSSTLENVLDRIRHEVAEILEIPSAEVDTSANLYDIGFDSVMALELRNALLEKYHIEVGLAPLMDAQCLEDVARVILQAIERAPKDLLAPQLPTAEIVL